MWSSNTTRPTTKLFAEKYTDMDARRCTTHFVLTAVKIIYFTVRDELLGGKTN